MTQQELLTQLRLRLPDADDASDALLSSLLLDAAALICALPENLRREIFSYRLART